MVRLRSSNPVGWGSFAPSRMRHRASRHVRYATDCARIDAWGVN
jgi:hypothetical protein